MLNKQHNLSFIIAVDEARDHALIQRVIQSIDITIHHTSVFSGSQLLDLLLGTGVYSGNPHTRPDALILNLNLPGADGLSTLRRIKSKSALREIPVFILHTLRMDDYTTKCRTLGIAGMYVKPCNTSELQTILNEIYCICGGTAYTPLKKKHQRPDFKS